MNNRGRPRKESDKLQRWIPPDGWVRVVAWVSPEERKILKHVAIEYDVSVAELIRAVSNSLNKGVITPEEIILLYRKGENNMEKIPTLFQRDDNFRVTEKVKDECKWVFEGQGTATEKLDGTNIRITIRTGQVVRVEKRRNPTNIQKKQGIVDGWYVDAIESNLEDKWIYKAVEETNFSNWIDGEHPCEALGPKIQGNPLGLEKHICVPFNLEIPIFEDVPRSFEEIRNYLLKLESKFSPKHLAEGIVFHHPDGRRAKIKRKDFKLVA